MKLSGAGKAGLAVILALAGKEVISRLREADLSGQLVLVTGGSRGLGLALAQEFGAQGCRLALCARDGEELARARETLQHSGFPTETFVCDLDDQAQAERLIVNVTQKMGEIDILVNNAGVISVGPLENLIVEDFEAAMATDFWGIVYPTLAVLPQMRQRKSGRIVNITSIGGKVSVPHLLPYSCAKFAATGFSEGLRVETAKDGITVTTIVPGLLRTGSFLHALFKGDHAGEYGWFSLGDNIPGLSISAKAAAHAVVQATQRGEAERVLGLPAKIAAKGYALAPGLAATVSGLVNRALPKAQPGTGDVIQTGAEVHAQNPSAARDAVTSLGFSAAERLNE